jgi:hypothetical protein
MTGVNFDRTEVDPNLSQHLALLAWLADHTSTRWLSPSPSLSPRGGEGQACALRWFRSPDLNPNSSQHLALLAWLEDHVLTRGLSPLTQPLPSRGRGASLRAPLVQVS